MRIPTSNAPADTPALTRNAEAAPTDAVDSSTILPNATPVVALQSAILKPATQAMRAMPEVDQARVAQLRDALSKGELPFDPAKLAGLVQRFHGGES